MLNIKSAFAIKMTALLIAIPIVFLFNNTYSQACDIAVVSASASSNGRPFIWKNRDNADSYRQEALFYPAVNTAAGGSIRIMGQLSWASNKKICSAGVNEAGFAIANTSVYETPDRELNNVNTDMMVEAIEQCINITDFENILNNWQYKVISGNFVVIDARGGAALYEAWSDGSGNPVMYEKFDANTIEEGFVNRTNSHQWIQLKSDTPRELRAYQLLDGLKDNNELNYRKMMQVIAKDICGGNCYDYDDSGEFWDNCQDDLDDPDNYGTRFCISRYQTTFAMVIDGVAQGEDPSLLTCWVNLGEPSYGVSTPHFPSARRITEYAFHNEHSNSGYYWDGVSESSDTKDNSFLNLAFDLFGTEGQYLYVNNGYGLQYSDNLGLMDRTINYNHLLEAQQWILPLETYIINKTEAFLAYMKDNPELVTQDSLYRFSHYCSRYVYENYSNKSDNYYTWTYEWDAEPPSVTDTAPVDGAIDVEINTNITAAFSEEIDPSTIDNLTFIVTDGSLNIAGEVVYDDLLRLVSFIPHSYLGYSATYTAIITTDVKDLAQNSLEIEYIWSFTTVSKPADTELDEPNESDSKSPTIVERNPPDKAENVATDISITVAFSESMDSDTINNTTFDLLDGSTEINGEIEYNDSNHTATFVPDSDLNYFKIYTVRITTGVKDLAGNTLEKEYTGSFTTVTDQDHNDNDDNGNVEDDLGLLWMAMNALDDHSSSSGCASIADASTLNDSVRTELPGIINSIILMLIPFTMILLHRTVRRRKRQSRNIIPL